MFGRLLMGGVLAGLCVAAFAGDDLSAADQATMDRWLGERREVGTPAATLPARTAPPVEQLLARLELRLHESPEDEGGWSLLAQTYAFLGRMDEARDAAARAAELGADAEELQRRLVAAHTERARAN